MLHVVELARVAPQSWRNGGGVTRELLAWPAGAGADWQLRVSVAEIVRNGPFSPFPGVQRCFAVLEGAGVVLAFADGERALGTGDEPLAFDGGLAPGCRLLGGPTRDLNLMARKAAGDVMMRLAKEGERLDGRRPLWRGVYAASPLMLMLGHGQRLAVPFGSLAWSEAPRGAWRVEAAENSALQAWWLQLDAHA